MQIEVSRFLLYLNSKGSLHKTKNMKKSLLAIFTLLLTTGVFAQDANCFQRLEKAFQKRGSYTVADDMHRNVYVSFFEEGDVYCVKGKARVENGGVVSIFLQFDDNTYELMDKKFYNSKKQNPTITNGISEMIYTADGEKLRIVFIDKLKPKQKKYKTVDLPDDL